MITWLFDSPQRLRVAAVGLGVLVLIMLVTMTTLRLMTIPASPQPGPTSLATPTPESTSTDLLPPEPAPYGASPTQDYGSSATIALEAVSAFLQGDRVRFAALGQQEVVEAVNDAPVPPPGQEITGSPETVLDGPTRQKVQVPTTDGPIDLDMIVVDGAWKVMDMRYSR